MSAETPEVRRERVGIEDAAASLELAKKALDAGQPRNARELVENALGILRAAAWGRR